MLDQGLVALQQSLDSLITEEAVDLNGGAELRLVDLYALLLITGAFARPEDLKQADPHIAVALTEYTKVTHPRGSARFPKKLPDPTVVAALLKLAEPMLFVCNPELATHIQLPAANSRIPLSAWHTSILRSTSWHLAPLITRVVGSDSRYQNL
ncbi:hypothetical protein [Kitasatospora sp. NPDC002040]|uniref:hypothetical protein n=1 Tax=Kitasatospora sp. NPDC002040 TaxID=3154661 RepID=UPI003326B2E6